MIQRVKSTMEFTHPRYLQAIRTNAAEVSAFDHVLYDYARSRPTYASLFYKYKFY